MRNTILRESAKKPVKEKTKIAAEDMEQNCQGKNLIIVNDETT